MYNNISSWKTGVYFIFFAIMATLHAPRIWAVEESVSLKEDPIAYIENYFNNMKGLVAEFKQISPDGSETTGSFYVMRPYDIRWQYNPPSPYLIIVNKNHATYYDYELDEMTHTTLEDNLANFLTRKKITFSGDIVVSDYRYKNGIIHMAITRKDKPEEGMVTLIFKDNPFHLKQFVTKNEAGEETSLQFTTIHEEENLPKKLFQAHMIRTKTTYRP